MIIQEGVDLVNKVELDIARRNSHEPLFNFLRTLQGGGKHIHIGLITLLL